MVLFSKDGNSDILSVLERIEIDEEFYDLPDIEFNNEEDSLLIHRVLTGDQDAFDIIVKNYQSMVFNIAYRFLNDYAEAEELTQEVFLRVFRFLPKFKGKSSLKTWIYRITVNSALNRNQWLKRRKQNRKISIDTPLKDDDKPMKENLESVEKNPEGTTLNSELQKQIQESIVKLPEKLRVAVILRDVEGLSYTDIADSLGVNIGTVKSRIARARTMLRDLLSRYLEE